jgi:hypothetical protein
MQRKRGGTGAALAAALLTLGALPGRAVAVDLVSQLDPFAGNNRYGDVWGEGAYAYLGSFRGSGVAIIDVSDPAAPFVATVYGAGAGGQFKDVKVRAGVGYFASDDGGGLHIVDLAVPTAPLLLAQVTSAQGGYDSIHNVFVAGSHLYEADSRTPVVKVIDVSDPTQPFFVRDIVTPDSRFIHDISLVCERLYASGFGGFTWIYDVSGIASGPAGLLGQAATGANSHSNAVTSDGSLLISATEISNGVVTLSDVSDPANPILLSTLDRASLGIDAVSPHNPVLHDDSLLFVSWYQAGVVAIDIRDPSVPQLVGQYDTFPGLVSGFDGNWGVYSQLGLDRVLLSDMDGGLFIVDASSVSPVPVPTSGAPGLGALAALLLGVGTRRLRAVRPGVRRSTGAAWPRCPRLRLAAQLPASSVKGTTRARGVSISPSGSMKRQKTRPKARPSVSIQLGTPGSRWASTMRKLPSGSSRVCLRFRDTMRLA